MKILLISRFTFSNINGNEQNFDLSKILRSFQIIIVKGLFPKRNSFIN